MTFVAGAMPPSLKLDQIVDFNLYLIRAILNGRGDEIIDLARTNLFRRNMVYRKYVCVLS